MILRDITTDTQTTYRLGANEEVVFFLHNRDGDLVFDLSHEGARAHIVALYDLDNDTSLKTSITQIHRAPRTTSRFLGRAVLHGQAVFDWRGLTEIQANGAKSNGSQEMKSLLLSPSAQAITIPSLEIKHHDVSCRHAATVSAPNAEHLFVLESRGISRQKAENLIVHGFVKDLGNALRELHIAESDLPIPFKHLLAT